MNTKTPHFFSGVWRVMLRRKALSVFIALLFVGGGYYAYGTFFGVTTETRYVLASVKRGTLVTSVSGTGQVSVSNQFDIKPKVSGNVVLVLVQEGQSVKAGTLITKLDSKEAEKTVRDAKANLRVAVISLQKLQEPADVLSMTQAQNAITQAGQSKQNAEDALLKAYDDGFTVVANAFIDLPNVVTGLNSVLNGTTVNGNQDNASAYYDMIKNSATNADQFLSAAQKSYTAALAAYNKNLQDYKDVSRYSDRADVDALIQETYETAKSISEAIKDTKTFLDLVNDTIVNVQSKKAPAILTAHETSLQTYTGTVNGHLGGLLNIENTIQNNKDTITNSEAAIEEKTQAFAKLKAGPNALDIQSQELAVIQRENALQDAQETLADYSILAPFDGVAAKISAKVGDPASSGLVLATMITPEKIAQISLNEVDVGKIQLYDKATLTFDAFPDLTIAGEVFQIDTLGAVAQGVVTYGVKIIFQTQDDLVKPGMSVSAAIITDTRENVLLAPNAGVKSQAGTRYVELLDGIAGNATTRHLGSQGVISETPPRRQTVEVGNSNDTLIEITSGVSEGDFIVVRTVATSSASGTQTQGSGFRFPGLGGR